MTDDNVDNDISREGNVKYQLIDDDTVYSYDGDDQMT